MAVNWDLLEKLRGSGAVKVSFHASGELESVEFGPTASDKDEPQHEDPKTPKRALSATGGLVPRAVPSDS